MTTTLHPRSASGAGARSRRVSAVQTHSILRSMIRIGSLATGVVLNEDELGQALGASRRATRDALQSLADEHLVTRRPRAGTVVCGGVVGIPSDQIVADTASPGRYAVTLLASQVIAGHQFAERVPSPSGRHRVREWLVELDDEPLCIRTSVVAEGPAVSRAVEGVADVAASFRHVFEAALGTIESTVEAVAVDARVGQLLEVPAGTPALLRELVLADVDGVARELSFTLYRGDGYAITSLTAF